MAKVVAVNISETKGVPKDTIEKGYFEVDCGLKGDAHAGAWHRQVSLLGMESVNKMKQKGLADLETGSFAENITTEGIILFELPVGTKLKIGETLMEVTQIGKECHAGVCDTAKNRRLCHAKRGYFCQSDYSRLGRNRR